MLPPNTWQGEQRRPRIAEVRGHLSSDFKSELLENLLKTHGCLRDHEVGHRNLKFIWLAK